MSTYSGLSIVVMAKSGIWVWLLCAPTDAQVRWTNVPMPAARRYHAIAYDSGRARLVLFGGAQVVGDVLYSDTWEWDGLSWVERTAPGPAARRKPAMTYDQRRGKIVLFGGWTAGTTVVNDTWEWDGVNWSLRSPPSSPPARYGHALSYDPVRGRVVLFGGYSSINCCPLADTWEWDGANWTRHTPAASPPARMDAGLAPDPVGSGLLLFGGRNPAAFADTWTWDGTNWLQRFPVTNPPPSFECALSTDVARRRVVYVDPGSGGRLTTWEWDGRDWNLLSPATVPPIRQFFAVGFDSARSRTILVGGYQQSSGLTFGDLWEWNGNNWAQRWSTPPQSTGPLTDAPGGQVLGLDFLGMWTWNGSAWLLDLAIPSPSARRRPGVAHDSRRGRVVLFGGLGCGYDCGDTWEWDGTNWLQVFPATSPAARRHHAMAYDAARGRVVLFGGTVNSNPLTDTWEFDGTNWTQRSPSSNPSAREAHAMAYDAVRGRVVLFGGDSGSPLSDTWEWDGSNWSRRTPIHVPVPRAGHGMAFDVARGRVVLFGGAAGGTNYLSDTWEWDGADWILRAPIASPPGMMSSSQLGLAYEAGASRMVLLGRSNDVSSQCWLYAPLISATYTAFGAGCVGSAGTPTLRAASGHLPWAGDTFPVQIANVLPVTSVLVLLGLSNTSWFGIPLPFDLTASGMPGCSALVSGELTFTAASSAGIATLSLPIPNVTALLSAHFYNQALVLDLAANPLGLTTSNGAEAVIGGR